MSFNIKKTFAKIKSFAADKPSISTKFSTSTEIYRASADKRPALSFNNSGRITLNIWHICAIVFCVAALCIITCASLSAKYKKKYNKKLNKMKAKFEKKEEKLLAAAEKEETTEE